MKYELLVLAAIVRLENPVNKTIVEATGISARKLQTTLKLLRDDLGMIIERINNKRTGPLQISDWGVFESGKKLHHQLEKIEFNNCCDQPTLIASLSFKEKQQYYETVKADNFRESSRLEGVELTTIDNPNSIKDTDQLMAAIIARYTKKSVSVNA
jgi:hypothetical protein